MILFLLFIVGMIGSWIFFGYACKNGDEGLAILFIALALAFTGTSMGAIAAWGSQNGDAVVFRADRDFYQDVIYNFSDSMSFDTVNRTISRAKAINDRIERDRRHCNNAFYGTFYNKKIAEIELIEIPEIHLKDFTKKNERDL